jgi:hypothetical protein
MEVIVSENGLTVKRGEISPLSTNRNIKTLAWAILEDLIHDYALDRPEAVEWICDNEREYLIEDRMIILGWAETSMRDVTALAERARQNFLLTGNWKVLSSNS